MNPKEKLPFLCLYLCYGHLLREHKIRLHTISRRISCLKYSLWKLINDIAFEIFLRTQRTTITKEYKNYLLFSKPVDTWRILLRNRDTFFIQPSWMGMSIFQVHLVYRDNGPTAFFPPEDRVMIPWKIFSRMTGFLPSIICSKVVLAHGAPATTLICTL